MAWSFSVRISCTSIYSSSFRCSFRVSSSSWPFAWSCGRRNKRLMCVGHDSDMSSKCCTWPNVHLLRFNCVSHTRARQSKQDAAHCVATHQNIQWPTHSIYVPLPSNRPLIIWLPCVPSSFVCRATNRPHRLRSHPVWLSWIPGNFPRINVYRTFVGDAFRVDRPRAGRQTRRSWHRQTYDLQQQSINSDCIVTRHPNNSFGPQNSTSRNYKSENKQKRKIVIKTNNIIDCSTLPVAIVASG